MMRLMSSLDADESDRSGRHSHAVPAIGDSVVESVLRTPELHSLAAEYVEAALDAFVDNALIDVIPIVGTIRGVVQGASSIRDALLAKKLVTMLSAIGEASEGDVAKWRERINTDGGRETGERVLEVVDRITSAHKATLIGKVFREYLDGRCDRSSFLRTVEMIDSALTEDLLFLANDWVEREWVDGDAYEGVSSRLIAVGLMKDRVTRLASESSQPPAPSAEGNLIRSAVHVVT